MTEGIVDWNEIDWSQPYNGATFKRREMHYAAASRAWYDPGTGLLIHDGGHQEVFPAATPLADVLDWLDVQEIRERPRYLMICGGTSSVDTPSRDELTAPAAHGWEVRMRYDEGKSAYVRSHVVYKRNGHTIDVRLTAEWFGDCRNAMTCHRAWNRLEQRVRSAFADTGVRLISSPGRTGIDLLERTVPREKGGQRAGWSYEYPCLSEPLQRLLRRNNGQGRLELIELAKRETLPGLYCLDGRWMYAACLANLPSGPVLHDTTDELMPYVPGFYRVSGTVPKGWRHIGLLPSLAYRGEEAEKTYPRRPGAAFGGWVTSAELGLAYDQGWTATIHERILWPEPIADVAKPWIAKLRTLREQAQELASLGSREDALIAAAIRSMVLMGIGMWHRSEGVEVGVQPVGTGDLPEGARFTAMRGGLDYWRRPTPLAQPHYSHPEWSATVWGRARARLAKQALGYPLASIVALRTDAIWLTFAPEIEDNGKPGAFRLKGPGIAHEIAAPHSDPELLTLTREALA